MGNVLYLFILAALIFTVALMVTLFFVRFIPRLFRSQQAQEQAEDSVMLERLKVCGSGLMQPFRVPRRSRRGRKG